jgi:hypothetical protein
MKIIQTSLIAHSNFQPRDTSSRFLTNYEQTGKLFIIAHWLHVTKPFALEKSIKTKRECATGMASECAARRNGESIRA